MWRIAVATSLVAGISLTLFLKFLQLFSWITWHPTTFLKGELTNGVARWIVLALIISVVGLILYSVLQYTYKVPGYLVGSVLGLVVGVLIEWSILHLSFDRSLLKKLSWPFIVVVMTHMIFIVQTAAFHRKNFAPRNVLPYKLTMLK